MKQSNGLRTDATKSGPATRFLEGIRHLFWGFKMSMKTPALRTISLLVIAINFIVYIALFGAAFAYRHAMSDFILEILPWVTPGGWLSTFVEVIVLIAWGILSIFLAIAIASILSSPLLDILSERTEKILTGHVSPLAFSLKNFLREIWIMLALMFKSMMLGLFALLVVGWIPVVGQLIPFVIASAFVALNFSTPALARHELSSQARTQMLLDNKAYVIGFGALANIPFANLFLIPLLTPALVVGGTRLFILLAANEHVPSKINTSQIAAFKGRSDEAFA